MALGTLSSVVATGGSSSPVFLDLISFPGDSVYPTGGSAGFEALFQTLTSSKRDVIAVIAQDCAGHIAVYDRANDKLKVYVGDNNYAADGPLAEVVNGESLAGVTFKVLVISK